MADMMCVIPGCKTLCLTDCSSVDWSADWRGARYGAALYVQSRKFDHIGDWVDSPAPYLWKGFSLCAACYQKALEVSLDLSEAELIRTLSLGATERVFAGRAKTQEQIEERKKLLDQWRKEAEQASAKKAQEEAERRKAWEQREQERREGLKRKREARRTAAMAKGGP